MTVVDTSVLIDWLADRRTPATTHLAALLRESAPLAITNLSRFELVQGIRDEATYRRTSAAMRWFEYYELTGLAAHDAAARRYARLRRRGVTIRKSIDVLIASFCLDHDFELLTSDRDFRPFAEHFGLKLAVAP